MQIFSFFAAILFAAGVQSRFLFSRAENDVTIKLTKTAVATQTNTHYVHAPTATVTQVEWVTQVSTFTRFTSTITSTIKGIPVTHYIPVIDTTKIINKQVIVDGTTTQGSVALNTMDNFSTMTPTPTSTSSWSMLDISTTTLNGLCIVVYDYYDLNESEITVTLWTTNTVYVTHPLHIGYASLTSPGFPIHNDPSRETMCVSNRALLTTVKLVSRQMSGYSANTVLFRKENGARILSLNRPEKLNALSAEMVQAISPTLAEYAKLASANMVILNSTSDRALCAGGDVQAAVRGIATGKADLVAQYFQDEYNLNYLIATFSKPFVALMNGITFGGGLGLCMHAPFRVATEKTLVAMPEMDIGFFPDVGATFFLSRLDDHLGYYYALTGRVLKGLDAYFAGFATHYVPLERIQSLIRRLLELLPPALGMNALMDYYALVNAGIEDFTDSKLPQDHQFTFSTAQIKTISQCFSQKTIEQILGALRTDGSEFAIETIRTLESKPMSLVKLTLALLERGSKNSIKSQLELETIVATNLVLIDSAKSDFFAGVSHKLIEKIREPAYPIWPGDYSDEWVEKMLLPSSATARLEQPLIKSFFNIDYIRYPHNMGLPTNADVEAYICGADGLNRLYLPTPSEVLVHFSRSFPKLGVNARVQQILDVHGEASAYDDKYVSWK